MVPTMKHNEYAYSILPALLPRLARRLSDPAFPGLLLTGYQPLLTDPCVFSSHALGPAGPTISIEIPGCPPTKTTIPVRQVLRMVIAKDTRLPKARSLCGNLTCVNPGHLEYILGSRGDSRSYNKEERAEARAIREEIKAQEAAEACPFEDDLTLCAMWNNYKSPWRGYKKSRLEVLIKGFLARDLALYTWMVKDAAYHGVNLDDLRRTAKTPPWYSLANAEKRAACLSAAAARRNITPAELEAEIIEHMTFPPELLIID